MNIVIHPEAQLELMEAAEYYEDQQPGLSDRFLDMMQSAVERIGTNPTHWPKDSQGRRRMVVHKFPYIIIYRVQHDCVYIILTFAHTSRRPGYWKSRDM